MKKITGGKAVVKALEACGVETIFGIPGVHNLEMYDALLDSSIRHVTARHEQGAGFMAYGYARSSNRKVGVALVISGPGLTNILTPIGGAFHDSIPILLISSNIASRFLSMRSGVLHELPESTLMTSPVTKERRRVTAAEKIPQSVVEAYCQTTNGRPGPVHVEIPVDLLQKHINTPWKEEIESAIRLFENKASPIQSELIEKACDILKAAKQPLVIAGGGARHAVTVLSEVAERLGAPVLLTTGGKGVIDEHHPLCLGVRHHFSSIREYVKTADVVLALGTELSADLYSNPVSIKGMLIQVDLDPANFECNSRADLGISGDAGEFLEALLGRIPEDKSKSLRGEQKVKSLLEQAQRELSDVYFYPNRSFILGMLEAIRGALPEGAILCADFAIPGNVGCSEFLTHHPSGYLFPFGYGTLGMALPAAIGAKIANPKTDVCVLAGDGGFQFTMPEIGVACQEKLCIPIIVWDDKGFGEIRIREEIRHPGRRIAVDHVNPDFVRLASAYGLPGVYVTKVNEMKKALKRALRHSGPSLIVIPAHG
jgi:thiamine pyrophosphate-dependent acetolactate synthase large subunit-like protein